MLAGRGYPGISPGSCLAEDLSRVAIPDAVLVVGGEADSFESVHPGGHLAAHVRDVAVAAEDQLGGEDLAADQGALDNVLADDPATGDVEADVAAPAGHGGSAVVEAVAE